MSPPVRTRYIRLVSSNQRYRHKRKDGGGGGGPVVGDIRITPTSATIVENSPQGTLVGVISSVPPNTIITLVDDAGGRFELDGYDLVAGAVPTDYESATEHTVVIRGTLGASSLDKPFVIEVIDVEELTGLNVGGDLEVSEDVSPGTEVGTVTSTPPGAVITIIDDAGGRFDVVDGVIVTGDTPLDYETNPTHTIVVEGTLGGETVQEEIIITVINVNEITDISLSANTLAENSSSGTLIGALTSTPPGATFSLVNSQGNKVAISGTDLVAGTTNSDYEVTPSYVITVRASLGADTFDKDFTINISDVDEVSNITLSNNTITENSGPGTVVGALTSTPTGATFSLTNTAGSRFAISGNNVVAGSVATDYESATSHSITVRATRLSEIFDKAFTINVLNDPGDDAPVYTLTVNRNLGNVTVGGNSASPPVTGSVQATASGGSSPYSYSWYRVSGASQVVANSPNSNTTTFTIVGGSKGNTYTAYFQCLATDNVGAQGIMSTECQVSITWT